MSAEDVYSRAVARIGVTTIAIGLAASFYMLFTRGWRAALAIAIGAALAWINFRWLKGGVSAIAAPAAAQADGNPPPVPRVRLSAFAKFIGRFALLLGVVYVILSCSLLPAIPLLAGLFATVAAALMQMILLLGAGLRSPK